MKCVFFFSLPLALDVKRMGAPHLFDQLVFLIWAHPSEPVSKRVGDPYLFDLVWFSNFLCVRRTAMGSYVVWHLYWPRLSRSTLGPPGKISFRVLSTRAISLEASLRSIVYRTPLPTHRPSIFLWQSRYLGGISIKKTALPFLCALDVKRMGDPHLLGQLVFLIWVHPSEPESKRMGAPIFLTSFGFLIICACDGPRWALMLFGPCVGPAYLGPPWGHQERSPSGW